MIDLAMIQKQGLCLAKRRGLAKSPLHSLEHLFSEVKEVRAEFVSGNLQNLGKELADVVLVAASIAEELDINLEEAIIEKHLFNMER